MDKLAKFIDAFHKRFRKKVICGVMAEKKLVDIMDAKKNHFLTKYEEYDDRFVLYTPKGEVTLPLE